MIYGSAAFFSIVTLIAYHWTLFALVLVLTALMNIVPRLMSAKLKTKSRELSETNERFVNQVQNFVEGFDVLASFHRLSELIRHINSSSKQLNQSNVVYSKQTAFVSFITSNISSLSQTCVILLTGFLALWHQITPGSLLTTGNLAGIIFTSLSQLISLTVVLKSVQPIFAKYATLELSVYKGDVPFQTDVRPSLTLHAVAAGRDTHHWLHANSLTLDFNDKLYLSFASGSGKSTMMRIIAGLSTPSSREMIWQPALPTTGQRELYSEQTKFDSTHALHDAERTGVAFSRGDPEYCEWNLIQHII